MMIKNYCYYIAFRVIKVSSLMKVHIDGVYFYRMQVTDDEVITTYSDTKKTVLKKII